MWWSFWKTRKSDAAADDDNDRAHLRLPLLLSPSTPSWVQQQQQPSITADDLLSSSSTSLVLEMTTTTTRTNINDFDDTRDTGKRAPPPPLFLSEKGGCGYGGGADDDNVESGGRGGGEIGAFLYDAGRREQDSTTTNDQKDYVHLHNDDDTTHDEGRHHQNQNQNHKKKKKQLELQQTYQKFFTAFLSVMVLYNVYWYVDHFNNGKLDWKVQVNFVEGGVFDWIVCDEGNGSPLEIVLYVTSTGFLWYYHSRIENRCSYNNNTTSNHWRRQTPLLLLFLVNLFWCLYANTETCEFQEEKTIHEDSSWSTGKISCRQFSSYARRYFVQITDFMPDYLTEMYTFMRYMKGTAILINKLLPVLFLLWLVNQMFLQLILVVVQYYHQRRRKRWRQQYQQGTTTTSSSIFFDIERYAKRDINNPLHCWSLVLQFSPTYQSRGQKSYRNRLINLFTVTLIVKGLDPWRDLQYMIRHVMGEEIQPWTHHIATKSTDYASIKDDLQRGIGGGGWFLLFLGGSFRLFFGTLGFASCLAIFVYLGLERSFGNGFRHLVDEADGMDHDDTNQNNDGDDRRRCRHCHHHGEIDDGGRGKNQTSLLQNVGRRRLLVSMIVLAVPILWMFTMASSSLDYWKSPLHFAAETILVLFVMFPELMRFCVLGWYKVKYNLARFDDKENAIWICGQRDGMMLRYLSQELQNDEVVVWAACRQNGLAIRHSSARFRSNAGVALMACQQNGNALQYVDLKLRMDKQLVLAAVRSKPESLKYALNGLNQDPDCLVAAGVWDADHDHHDHQEDMLLSSESSPSSCGHGHTQLAENRKHIVLSTKFSLGERSTPTATQFTVLLKQHPFIRDNNFSVYSPNCFNKNTCDPFWTRKEWPCRGTYETCRMQPQHKTGIPTDASCWRYSFRRQLEEARATNGLMIQLVELHRQNEELEEDLLPPNNGGGHNNDDSHAKDDDGIFLVSGEEYELGKGQSIETEMALDVGTEVIQVYQPCIPSEMMHAVDLSQVDRVVARIREHYEQQPLLESDALQPNVVLSRKRCQVCYALIGYMTANICAVIFIARHLGSLTGAVGIFMWFGFLVVTWPAPCFFLSYFCCYSCHQRREEIIVDSVYNPHHEFFTTGSSKMMVSSSLCLCSRSFFICLLLFAIAAALDSKFARYLSLYHDCLSKKGNPTNDTSAKKENVQSWLTTTIGHKPDQQEIYSF